jgi:Protein kinase domain
LDCLDENLVVDFVRGQLPPAVAHEVGLHLDGCVACRLLVASAAKSSVGAWSSSRHKTSQPSQDGTSASPDSTVEDHPAATPDDRPTDRSLSDLNTGPFVRSPELVSPGQLLDGRFRLRRPLGRGAMGQIYAAYDERLKVQVALKLLLPEFAANRAYLEKLHQEIVSARRISHPNVCRVYDLGKSNGIHFISMEIVEGSTLEEALQREKFSTRAALNILRQIVLALDAAHRCGVVHRDLKPANIMINGHGHVTVMDFGLARDLNRESTERQGPAGSVVGTPAYWSPEQSRGERATPASDLFSLGVIACRLFTGKRPHGDDPLQAVPAAYREVVARCLEPDPLKRYSSAEAVHLALRVARRDARPAWVPYARGSLGALVAVAAVMGLRTWLPLRGAVVATGSGGAVALSAPSPSGGMPGVATALPSPAIADTTKAPDKSAAPEGSKGDIPKPPVAASDASSRPTGSHKHTLAPPQEREVLRNRHDPPPPRVPVFD